MTNLVVESKINIKFHVKEMPSTYFYTNPHFNTIRNLYHSLTTYTRNHQWPWPWFVSTNGGPKHGKVNKKSGLPSHCRGGHTWSKTPVLERSLVSEGKRMWPWHAPNFEELGFKGNPSYVVFNSDKRKWRLKALQNHRLGSNLKSYDSTK